MKATLRLIDDYLNEVEAILDEMFAPGVHVAVTATGDPTSAFADLVGERPALHPAKVGFLGAVIRAYWKTLGTYVGVLDVYVAICDGYQYLYGEDIYAALESLDEARVRLSGVRRWVYQVVAEYVHLATEAEWRKVAEGTYAANARYYGGKVVFGGRVELGDDGLVYHERSGNPRLTLVVGDADLVYRFPRFDEGVEMLESRIQTLEVARDVARRTEVKR